MLTNLQPTQQDWLHRGLPPALRSNHCHISPERNGRAGQKLWFVNAPYGGSLLRFRGEPTSLLYAIAPSVQEIRQGRIQGLTMEDVALLNPAVASNSFYIELERRLEAQRLRAIGISTMTAGCTEARRIAALAKAAHPETVVIFGGPHEDDVAENTALDPRFCDLVDFSVSGNGEYALLTLLKILFDNPRASVEESKAAVLERQDEFAEQPGKGLVSLVHDSRARRIFLRNQPLCLNQLPRMPRELLHESDTRTFNVFKRGGWNVKTAQVMTHRGCYWRCNFCSESSSVNERSVESVITEIEEVLRFRSLYPDLDRSDYEAVFFDDSTFTNHSPRRRRFLNDLLPELGRLGVEWGCQTRLDQIEGTALKDMKKAGCSYIYTGMESASNEMLRAMVKDEDRSRIERSFSDIAQAGLRVGISLVFGAAATGSTKTTENETTIRETMDFVSRQVERGNVAIVSPNLATFYPGTRMTTHSGLRLDFHNPVVNRGYPWNRFEEGEGFHPLNVTAEMAENILRKSIVRFGECMADQDLYSLEEYQYAYRTGMLETLTVSKCKDFNHASLASPMSSARAAARSVVAVHESAQANLVYEEARELAATLMGVPQTGHENVALARNATEAAALAFSLSGLDGQIGADILCSDAENLSIPRSFRFAMDHGNSRGYDLWSSFQDFGARAPGSLADAPMECRETGVNVRQIEVLSRLDDLEEEVLRNVVPETRLVVFSHVIRDTGRICNVQGLCRQIRTKNPDTMILVDGAQALGALPRVDVEKLGCDFYIAAPHKTLGSFPLGILYMTDAVKARVKNRGWHSSVVVRQGMFSPALGVAATSEKRLSLSEVAGFSAICRELNARSYIQGNDCNLLDDYRGRLKSKFLARLQLDFKDLEVASPLSDRYSNFIVAFRIPGMDNRAIVERLWREHLVFASYIARTDLIRFSFALNNTEKMVNEAVNLTRRVFESCKSEANRGLSAPYLGYNPTANSIAMMNYVRSGNQSEPFVILP